MKLIVRKIDNEVMPFRQSGDQKTEAFNQKLLLQASTTYGGVATDYECVTVPPGEEMNVIPARYITYNENTFTYDLRPRFQINGSGSQITVNSGWVKGIHRLLTDDITDFSTLGNTEDMYFVLRFYQHTGTLAISVELFLWTEDEDPDYDLLVTESKMPLQIICEGIIDTNQQISIQ